MFRDAARIGQITVGETSPRDSKILAEALSYFDRAAAIRLGRESMARLAETSLSHLASEAEEALAAEDTQRLREVGLNLKDAGRGLAEEMSGELNLAAIVIDAARQVAPPAMETVVTHSFSELVIGDVFVAPFVVYRWRRSPSSSLFVRSCVCPGSTSYSAIRVSLSSASTWRSSAC